MAASIKSIRSAFHGILHSRAAVTIDEARAIRAAMKLGEAGAREADQAMQVLNGLLDGHGVEAVYDDVGYAVALYVNMGEMYAPTVIYTVPHRHKRRGGTFIIRSLGDWVESNSKKTYRIP